MKFEELMAQAAPIAAALIARIPASQPNNGLADDEIKSALLQALRVVKEVAAEQPPAASFFV